MKLQNRIAIVTGAGSGMGRAITGLYVKEGATVIAADINDKGVNELISEMKDDGARIVFQKVDVSDRKQVEAVIDFTVQKFGRLDILVNNAGIMDEMMPVTEVTDDLWTRVMEIDLYGVMYACRHAIPIMTKQEKGGCIINTASIGGLQGTRAGAAYTAAKHGVVGLTKNIGFMYAQEGIRCNAICPGSILTNIGSGMKNVSKFGMERATACMGTSPRDGEAAEVATVALFLASDDASFVNGTTITVDGGWTAY